MKAKVKETGEIIEVIAYSMDDNIITQYLSKDGYIIYESNELEIIFDQTHNNSKNILINPINWEQRRWEAAIKIYCARFTFQPNDHANFEAAVYDAGKLIEEYKKQNE